MRRTIKSLIAAQNRPSTPQEVAERITYRKAQQQAVADTKAKFPVLSADNFGEAMDYQEERIRQLLIEARKYLGTAAEDEDRKYEQDLIKRIDLALKPNR